MLLNDCIESCLDKNYPFVAGDADVAEVLALMQEKRLECLPVLHEGKITAIVTLLDLLPVKYSRKTNKRLLSDLKLKPAESIGRHQHLFDIFSRIRSFPGTIMPVSEEDGKYAGIIEKGTLLDKIASVFHLTEEGMTLELDLPAFELKLSEVIATLEKNDATVLSFGMYHATPSDDSILITFKVQTHDLFRLVKNMEKYGYLIRYTSPFFKESDDELRDKALEFIHFMDM
jgi:signal-transduction protein with cAMP-binding, CBS, and nucleotidyltransferase domain